MIPSLGGGGVCRKLFGPVDHEQLSRDLSRQLRDVAERDTRRWNFSFETDEPLPGRYRWESVVPGESATREAATEEEEEDVAQRSTSRLFEEEGTEACLDRENCSRVSNTSVSNKFPCEVTPVAARRKRTSAHTMRTPQNNTHITGQSPSTLPASKH